MAILGISDLKRVGLPTAWDANEIMKVRLASGQTFGDFMRSLRNAIPLINQALVTGELGWVGRLVAFQDNPEVAYPVGTMASGVRPSGEYSDAIPFRGKISGHMLPIQAWERALGWTRVGLLKANQQQLDADVRSAITDIKLHWQKAALQRLFKFEADVVGSTGKSPGFADGGAAIGDYAPPPSPRGEKFATTHNHYLRKDDITDANVKAAVYHLWEHGHPKPYTLVASEADRAKFAALDGWVKPAVPGVQVALTETRAQATDLTPFDGYYDAGELGLVQVRFAPLVPAGYFGIYKDYGVLDPRNPLRVRWDSNIGVGWSLWPGQDFGKRALAMFYAEYGFGVGEDRTNGVLVKIAGSGDYTTPAIG